MAKFKKKNNKTIRIAYKGFSRWLAGLKTTLPAFHEEKKSSGTRCSNNYLPVH
jgi:hypothetical protein